MDHTIERHETTMAGYIEGAAGGRYIFHPFAIDAPVKLSQESEPPSPRLDVIRIHAPLVILRRQCADVCSRLAFQKTGQSLHRGLLRTKTQFLRRTRAGDRPVISELIGIVGRI